MRLNFLDHRPPASDFDGAVIGINYQPSTAAVVGNRVRVHIHLTITGDHVDKLAIDHPRVPGVGFCALNPDAYVGPIPE